MYCFQKLKKSPTLTFIIELPDELAARLNVMLPEDTQARFAVSAIWDALLAKEFDLAGCIFAFDEAMTDVEMKQALFLRLKKCVGKLSAADLKQIMTYVPQCNSLHEIEIFAIMCLCKSYGT